MQEIYLLYSCDEWKSHSSMSLVMASVNDAVIRNEVKKQIKKRDMKYGADIEDLVEDSLSDLKNCLEYGHIDIVVDGEVQ